MADEDSTGTGRAGRAKPITLRSRIESDDPEIVAIYRDQEGDSVPLNVESYRDEHADQSPGSQSEGWVAVEDDRVVGYGSFSPAWWTGSPDAYSLELRVPSSRQREGIGTRLFNVLHGRLTDLGATRLLAWVRADSGTGRRFASGHGFVETGQVIQEYRLHLPDVMVDGEDGPEERLRRQGLTITSLAQRGIEDESFLHALQHLWADSEGSPPDPERLHDSFAEWQRKVLQAPGLSPETHWVALEDERPVGMTFLRRLSEDAAENDYTGVATTHRNHGIATALKWHAIARAREQGFRWFFTSSEIRNAPMIGINRRLGYQPGVQRIEVGRVLRGQ